MLLFDQLYNCKEYEVGYYGCCVIISNKMPVDSVFVILLLVFG